MDLLGYPTNKKLINQRISEVQNARHCILSAVELKHGRVIDSSFRLFVDGLPYHFSLEKVEIDFEPLRDGARIFPLVLRKSCKKRALFTSFTHLKAISFLEPVRRDGYP